VTVAAILTILAAAMAAPAQIFRTVVRFSATDAPNDAMTKAA
jgi:hypothetical protein